VHRSDPAYAARLKDAIVARFLDTNESLRTQFAAQRKSLGGTAIFQRSEVNLLDPAPGATIRAGLGRIAA